MTAGDGIVLEVLAERLAIVRLSPGQAIPVWAWQGKLVSVIRTEDELSVVCSEAAIPAGTVAALGWCAFKVRGPLSLELTGVLSSLVQPLAARQIPVFVLSTFDTDYVLVRANDVSSAVAALEASGHRVCRDARTT